ncbi:MAG: hypothetical protein K8F25_09720, partial [Fimbriimonadaceae bacterium]|nr:hypothetical protein [Alphaproteobacteria bacterium]
TLEEHNRNVANWRAYQQQQAEDLESQEETAEQQDAANEGDATAAPASALRGILNPPIPELMPGSTTSPLTPPPARN